MKPRTYILPCLAATAIVAFSTTAQSGGQKAARSCAEPPRVGWMRGGIGIARAEAGPRDILHLMA